jgi:hypothetical protein
MFEADIGQQPSGQPVEHTRVLDVLRKALAPPAIANLRVDAGVGGHGALPTRWPGRWLGRPAMKAAKSDSRMRRDLGPSRTLGSSPDFSSA